MKVIARSYYDAVGNSADEGLRCEDPSLAVQASKDECDINNIINKYLRSGELPELRQGIYADISELGDLRESLEVVRAAEESFMALPADVRRFFDNDPVKLVEFAADPGNTDKAIELGLATRRPDLSPPAPGQGASEGSQPAPKPAKT